MEDMGKTRKNREAGEQSVAGEEGPAVDNGEAFGVSDVVATPKRDRADKRAPAEKIASPSTASGDRTDSRPSPARSKNVRVVSPGRSLALNGANQGAAVANHDQASVGDSSVSEDEEPEYPSEFVSARLGSEEFKDLAIPKKESLFWWDRADQSHMVLAALMQIGVIYGFVWTVNEIHEFMWSTGGLVGLGYRLWFRVNRWILNTWFSATRSVLKYLDNSISLYAPKVISVAYDRIKALQCKYYDEIDYEVAQDIRMLIRHNPKLKESTLELLDDLVHYIIRFIKRRFFRYTPMVRDDEYVADSVLPPPSNDELARRAAAHEAEKVQEEAAAAAAANVAQAVATA